MDGTYNVSISTPIGQQNGTINLVNKEGVLSGYIRALGNNNPIRNGKANLNSFEFEGTIKTVFSNIDFIASGTIVDDLLQATAKTRYGIIQIRGTRNKAL